MRRLVANRAHDFIDAAGLFGALWETAIGTETAPRRPIRTGRDDGRPRHEEPRPRRQPLRDGALERHIGIARALGAQIAQRGESGGQRVARMVHRAHGAIGLALLQHLIVPRRLVVGMQEEMRMQIHQPRQQGATRKFDLLIRLADPTARRDADDAIALDQHRKPRAHALPGAPDTGRMQRDAHDSRQTRGWAASARSVVTSLRPSTWHCASSSRSKGSRVAGSWMSSTSA